MSTYTLHRGTTPLLLSIPHCGREIPAEMRDAYVPRALALEDTDWFVDRLYDFARELGASLLVPRYSRYLIDLNRPPDNKPMYAGENNTELCPTRFFSGEALYRAGRAPDIVEIDRRCDRYWRPYHDALGAELARLKQAHGHAVLFDAHSIRSVLPWLFEGKLPDLNLGTAGGTSCAPTLREALARVLASQAAFTHVVDGRFQGGYITRHYGRPEHAVHAVQLEMCWHCYMSPPPGRHGPRSGPSGSMEGSLPLGGTARSAKGAPTSDEQPFVWEESRAALVRPLLRELVRTVIAWRPA